MRAFVLFIWYTGRKGREVQEALRRSSCLRQRKGWSSCALKKESISCERVLRFPRHRLTDPAAIQRQGDTCDWVPSVISERLNFSRIWNLEFLFRHPTF